MPTRLTTPVSASIVPVLMNWPWTETVDVPVPPVLRMVPALSMTLALNRLLIPALDSIK